MDAHWESLEREGISCSFVVIYVQLTGVGRGAKQAGVSNTVLRKLTESIFLKHVHHAYLLADWMFLRQSSNNLFLAISDPLSRCIYF